MDWRRGYVQKSGAQAVLFQIGRANRSSVPALSHFSIRLYKRWTDQLPLVMDPLRFALWDPSDVLLDLFRWLHGQFHFARSGHDCLRWDHRRICVGMAFSHSSTIYSINMFSSYIQIIKEASSTVLYAQCCLLLLALATNLCDQFCNIDLTNQLFVAVIFCFRVRCGMLLFHF